MMRREDGSRLKRLQNVSLNVLGNDGTVSLCGIKKKVTRRRRQYNDCLTRMSLQTKLDTAQPTLQWVQYGSLKKQQPKWRTVPGSRLPSDEAGLQD